MVLQDGAPPVLPEVPNVRRAIFGRSVLFVVTGSLFVSLFLGLQFIAGFSYVFSACLDAFVVVFVLSASLLFCGGRLKVLDVGVMWSIF